MNKRQQYKYLKHDVPCAHGEIFQETYWSSTTILCKASRNGEDFCGFCKRYKPKYKISMKRIIGLWKQN